MQYLQDTITAIATPIGTGAIGIVRLSGPESLEITQKLFLSRHNSLRPYTLTHGWIKNRHGKTLDEVLVSFMPGPGSYTGEDVVEINCHGNPAVMEALLEALVAMGARQAEPGEFTKRSFLNGKMDLTQAEAVLEMINAPTETGVYLARNKLKGRLGLKIVALRGKLQNLKERLCLAVDFPEEEVECLSRHEIVLSAEDCREEIAGLIAGFEQGRIWTDGVLTVLTGKVNAGKSSLMNAVIGKERAIVTDIPGTTRDYLEEAVNLDGLPVRLVDTAGLREALDHVEVKGMEKGRQLILCADILVLVMDASQEPSPHDREILDSVDPEKLVIALNKWDLVSSPPDWVKELQEKHPLVYRVSAINGTGIANLMAGVRKTALAGKKYSIDGSLIPNLRQKACLERAEDELARLTSDAGNMVSYDLLAASLDYACSQLDQVTGKITPDQVLNSIFDKFCIGK